MIGPDRLLTVFEAAAHLNVSSKTIRRKITAGEIVVVRIGRSVRIQQIALRRYEHANVRVGQASPLETR